MIEITVGQLKNNDFIGAMVKLTKAQGFDGKVIYHIARLSKLLDQELASANEAYQKLLKEYVEEIEIEGKDGKKVKQQIIPEAKMEQWQAAFKSFHEAKVKIPKDKLYFSYIEKFKFNGEEGGWTSSEILSLEPVLHDIEIMPPKDGMFRGGNNLKPIQGGQNGQEKSVEENH